METPTQEMIDFFEQRTAQHINYVRENLLKMYYFINDEQLLIRAENHDISKYSVFEYTPYVFFSWKMKLKREGVDYTLSKEMSRNFDDAWEHHYLNNDHHLEFWKKNEIPNIPRVALIELCCDITAMSREFNDNPYEFILHRIYPKYNLLEEQKILILNTIQKLM